MEKIAQAVSVVLREAVDDVYAEISRLLQVERDRFDEERKKRFYQDREDFERRILTVIMANFERKAKTFRAANTRCFVVGTAGYRDGHKGFHWRTVEHSYTEAEKAMQPGEEVRAGQILIDRYPRIRVKRKAIDEQIQT